MFFLSGFPSYTCFNLKFPRWETERIGKIGDCRKEMGEEISVCLLQAVHWFKYLLYFFQIKIY